MRLSRKKASSLDVASDAVCFLGRRKFSGLSFNHIAPPPNQICARLPNVSLWNNTVLVIFAFENKNFRHTSSILYLRGNGHILDSVSCHTDTFISVYRCRQNFLSWKNWKITSLVGTLNHILHLLMELWIILVLATAAVKLLTLMRMLKGKV